MNKHYKFSSLINNCIYLVNTEEGKICLSHFCNDQLGKDNLPIYIKNDNFQNNINVFKEKIEILKDKKGEKYNNIDDLKKTGIVDKSCKINNPLFRYFVAYCMKEGVAILPNPNFNNVIKKDGKKKGIFIEKKENVFIISFVHFSLNKNINIYC